MALYAEGGAGAGPLLLNIVGKSWFSMWPLRPWKATLDHKRCDQIRTTEAAVWYESAEYQAVVGKRLSATEGFSVFTEHERG